MDNLFDSNGLFFWTEKEIKVREMMVNHMVLYLQNGLRVINRGFDFVRCEAPIITPTKLVNPNYDERDVFRVGEDFTLRPETTMGSYEYAKHILNPHMPEKHKLPLVVWQHGKSFRQESDKTIQHMRLKEFYQLEFQILHSVSTVDGYFDKVIQIIYDTVAVLFGTAHTFIEASERLPSYSLSTIDIIVEKDGYRMEVASISKRKDFVDAYGDLIGYNIEVAIGTDRLVYLFTNR